MSFDPPGAMSVGLCLAHAMLPKETWLAQHDITTPWPLWGKPAVVHADNAKEFRGRMLTRAGENLGIDLHWRPVTQPHYGGYIERLCGTLNQSIHTLPGTTFSHPRQRGAYRSEQQAAEAFPGIRHRLQRRHLRQHDECEAFGFDGELAFCAAVSVPSGNARGGFA